MAEEKVNMRLGNQHLRSTSGIFNNYKYITLGLGESTFSICRKNRTMRREAIRT